MTRNRAIDQVLLLFAAVGVAVGVVWATRFMENHGVSAQMIFFIEANVSLAFILTWQGVVFFGRAPRFWIFHICWIILHIVISGAWAYSGYALGLCVVVVPLEAYLYYRIGRARFREAHSIDDARESFRIGSPSEAPPRSGPVQRLLIGLYLIAVSMTGIMAWQKGWSRGVAGEIVVLVTLVFAYITIYCRKNCGSGG